MSELEQFGRLKVHITAQTELRSFANNALDVSFDVLQRLADDVERAFPEPSLALLTAPASMAATILEEQKRQMRKKLANHLFDVLEPLIRKTLDDIAEKMLPE